jgi:hypothetical protein
MAALHILFMGNPPFVCPDWSPCRPSYLGTGWVSSQVKNKSMHVEKCLFGGLKTNNGVCIHGFKVELFKVISNRLSRFRNETDTFSLWYTNSTVTKV